MTPPPPPPSPRERPVPEWQIESVQAPVSSGSGERSATLARIAVETIAHETGAEPVPALISLIEPGLAVVLHAIDGKVPRTGPRRGQYSGKTAMQRLRDRDTPGDSGRRRSPLTEDLVSWGVASELSGGEVASAAPGGTGAARRRIQRVISRVGQPSAGSCCPCWRGTYAGHSRSRLGMGCGCGSAPAWRPQPCPSQGRPEAVRRLPPRIRAGWHGRHAVRSGAYSARSPARQKPIVRTELVSAAEYERGY